MPFRFNCGAERAFLLLNDPPLVIVGADFRLRSGDEAREVGWDLAMFDSLLPRCFRWWHRFSVQQNSVHIIETYHYKIHIYINIVIKYHYEKKYLLTLTHKKTNWLTHLMKSSTPHVLLRLFPSGTLSQYWPQDLSKFWTEFQRYWAAITIRRQMANLSHVVSSWLEHIYN